MTPAIIKDVHKAALAEAYSEPDDALAIELGLPPSEFYGRTLLEVMLIRRARGAARLAALEPERVDAILDRELGKPKTTSENHNINESYEHALGRIRAQEPPAAAPASVPVDAELVTPPADDAWKDLI